jgi:hypothetical protein
MSLFRPTRSQAIDQGPVTDLDAIIAEPVCFKFKGKIHRLNPIDLKDFLKYTNAQAALMRIVNDQEAKLTAQQLGERYLAVISPLCQTITIDDIMSMEQVQVAALYQLVIDMVTGQVDQGDGKKKRRKLHQIYDSVQASS